MIADVRSAILGADFLAEFALAPNTRDAELFNIDTGDVIAAAARIGCRVVRHALEHPLPPRTLLNVNVPPSRSAIFTPSFLPIRSWAAMSMAALA